MYMKKFGKALSVLLLTAMTMSLGSCDLAKDKSMDEIADLAEDVCKYTADLDYKKLSKMTEDGDEELEEIFEGIEDDGFREVVASTLEYEIDEDSLEKDGKKGYTIDVTFAYVDYEEVLEDDSVITVEDFEDAVEDCEEKIEESITLEFEKDGDDILFVNIGDLADLFPYWDEALAPDVTGVVGNIDADPTVSDTSATDTSETTDDYWSDYELGGVWDDDRYPDPEPYLIDGEQYLLPNTNLLFTVPADAPATGMTENGIDSCFFMIGGYWGNTWEDYYSLVDGTHESCFSESAQELHYSNIDMFAEGEPGYVSHEVTTMEVTVCGVTYEGVLATITRANGEIVYHYQVLIGNEDFYYVLSIRTRNLDDIINFGENFTLVEV